jgi:hypothetical protein
MRLALVYFIYLISLISMVGVSPVFAQNRTISPFPSVFPTETLTLTPSEIPTKFAIKTQDRLESLLESQQLTNLSLFNFLRYSIKSAVAAGVSGNTIALLLLFPLIITLIAAARHLLGLRGFGIFTPAVIAVAFLSTGLTLGLGLFLGALLIAAVSRVLTRPLKLQYLPRLSLLILFITIGILGFLLAAPAVFSRFSLNFAIFAIPGIFPILLLILLTETFISAEISHGGRFALRITVETLFLAVVSYLIMDLKAMQSWVLFHPEVTILSLLSANILLGRFTGLRLLEYWRFRELLKK